MSIKDLFDRLIGREGELEASPVLERMALLGDADAQYKLGALCYQGDGIEQDLKGAFKWFSGAAGQGQTDAQYALGEMYYYGHGVKQNYEQALRWYQKAAGRAQADAQYALGRAYYYGWGAPQDYQQALEWYRKAAEQGQLDALCALGEMYSNGNGVGQDKAYALCWYEQASERGHADAQYHLGIIYEKGHGAKKNSQVALMWYLQAAGQGHVQAQCALADLYYQGEGTAQDHREAMGWYRKAAEQGDEYAQCALGAMYYQGKGEAVNYNKAFKWYQAAAEQDNAEAERILGDMYYYGYGVEHDYDKAFQWYRKAAKQGDTIAAEHITRLTSYLEKRTEPATQVNEASVDAPATMAPGPINSGSKVSGPISAREASTKESDVKSLLADFNSLIGLERVKQELNTLFSLIRVNQMRKVRGLPSQKVYYDCIFTGHVGTGKSMVAEQMAQIYHELGVLDKAHFCEVRAGTLIDKDPQATGKRIQEMVLQNLGGLLYIDQLYVLGQQAGEEYENQVCDTLLGLMEKYEAQLVVVLAGDHSEIQSFLTARPLLRARFHHIIHFEDYNGAELRKILVSMLVQTGYSVTADAEEYILEVLDKQVARNEFQLSNARGLASLQEKALARQAVRLIENMEGISDEQLITLTREDFM